MERRTVPTKQKTVPEWARDNVHFGEEYPTDFKGAYDPDLFPLWVEPQEKFTDPAVRGIVMVKPSQGGGSEVALNAIRYCTAYAPENLLYIGAQKEATEDFFDERIIPSLEHTIRGWGGYRSVVKKPRKLKFERSMVMITWASSAAGLKSRTLRRIIGDEFDSWPIDAGEKAKKRIKAMRNAQFFLFSALDKDRKAKSSPILAEFEASDKRYWFMKDPQKGQPFKFEMGSEARGKKTRYGLKWCPKSRRRDGSWDLEKVRATAHYVTPAGTVIKERDRLRLVHKGKWVATGNKSDVAGYHANAFYMPLESCSFGAIAVDFLEAKAKGAAHLRIFIMEVLSEDWESDREKPNDDDITLCQGASRDYRKGVRFREQEPLKTFYIGKDYCSLMTIDVQKDHFWYVVREHIRGGDSGLINFGREVSWDALEQISLTEQCLSVGVDMNYRKPMVLQECYYRKMLPMRGESHKAIMPWTVQKALNIFEGDKGGKQSLGLCIDAVSFQPNDYKDLLHQRIQQRNDAAAWFVYNGIEPTYRQQMTSEQSINGKWGEIKDHMANHLWDCEAMQIVLCAVVQFDVDLEAAGSGEAYQAPEVEH